MDTIPETPPEAPAEIVERIRKTDQYIARILRRCLHVHTLWSSEFTVVNSRTHKRFDGTPRQVIAKRLTYCLVGDREDIPVAVMFVQELHPMMQQLLRAHLRKTGDVWSAQIAHSFFDGLTDGYIDANRRGEKEAMLEAGEAAASQYALAVVDKDAAAREFITNNIETVRSRRISGPRYGGFDSAAYEQGAAHGSKINLANKRLK